jgi:hypothetical protein
MHCFLLKQQELVRSRVSPDNALYENVGKIEDRKVLVQTLRPLTAASLQATDSRDEGLESPDLAYMALKQVLDKVDDQAALKTIISPMAEALKSDQRKRRRYAAHAVMLFGHKVEDKAALAKHRFPGRC